MGSADSFGALAIAVVVFAVVVFVWQLIHIDFDEEE